MYNIVIKEHSFNPEKEVYIHDASCGLDDDFSLIDGLAGCVVKKETLMYDILTIVGAGGEVSIREYDPDEDN